MEKDIKQINGSWVQDIGKIKLYNRHNELIGILSVDINNGTISIKDYMIDNKKQVYDITNKLNKEV